MKINLLVKLICQRILFIDFKMYIIDEYC